MIFLSSWPPLGMSGLTLHLVLLLVELLLWVDQDALQDLANYSHHYAPLGNAAPCCPRGPMLLPEHYQLIRA